MTMHTSTTPTMPTMPTMPIDHNSARVSVAILSDVMIEEISRYMAYHLKNAPPCTRDKTPMDVQYAVDMHTSEREDASGCLSRLVPSIRVGVGRTDFVFEGQIVSFVCEEVGPPLSSHKRDRETTLHQQARVLAGDVMTVERLCVAACEHAMTDIPHHFQILHWRAASEYWRRSGYTPTRALDSVIMDTQMKNRIVSDVCQFFSRDTKSWFNKHGIPHRRGYLFEGPPGTGKTSMICAIATYAKCKVYYVSLVAPGLSDDSLMTAMNMAEPNSLIVMEDLDALFNKHREKNESCQLTFSGLLNAIDGINASVCGCLIIMTTNYLNRLDHALTRSGRVDAVFTFTHASETMCRGMFDRFYPNEEAVSYAFAHNVKTMFTSKQIKMPSMSDLQSHFIRFRDSSAREAASEGAVTTLAATVDARSSFVVDMWS